MITELNDAELIANILGGDFIVMDTKCQVKCLVDPRNHCRSRGRKTKRDEEKTAEEFNEFIVLVQFTTCIEKAVDLGILLFKLSDIHSTYVGSLGRPWN